MYEFVIPDGLPSFELHYDGFFADEDERHYSLDDYTNNAGSWVLLKNKRTTSTFNSAVKPFEQFVVSGFMPAAMGSTPEEQKSIGTRVTFQGNQFNIKLYRGVTACVILGGIAGDKILFQEKSLKMYMDLEELNLIIKCALIALIRAVILIDILDKKGVEYREGVSKGKAKHRKSSQKKSCPTRQLTVISLKSPDEVKTRYAKTGYLGGHKCPHVRRSHTRTLKSGKVIKVKGAKVHGGLESATYFAAT